MDIRFNIPEAEAICNVIAGNSNLGISTAPAPATIPYFIWNGTDWTLASTPVSRIDVIQCFP
jgi:hypothetical protein